MHQEPVISNLNSGGESDHEKENKNFTNPIDNSTYEQSGKFDRHESTTPILPSVISIQQKRRTEQKLVSEEAKKLTRGLPPKRKNRATHHPDTAHHLTYQPKEQGLDSNNMDGPLTEQERNDVHLSEKEWLVKNEAFERIERKGVGHQKKTSLDHISFIVEKETVLRKLELCIGDIVT